MLSKINFLKMAMDHNYFSSEKYYWVDAGLFHNGLIPSSLGGMERYMKPKDETFWPNPNNICKPDLIDKLAHTINDELLFIGMTNPHFVPNWWNDIAQTPKEMHIVGGFFGGNKDALSAICSVFETLAGQIFARGELTLEEDILTIIVTKNKYAYLKFDTWFHDVESDACYYNVDNQKSFYKVFI